MKFLTTTIKRCYMDLILSGKKTIEYKGYIDHWKKRIDKILKDPGYPADYGINFLCGQIAYKYKITKIVLVDSPKEIAGTTYPKHYEIHFEPLIKPQPEPDEDFGVIMGWDDLP
jgi:hypothetical protein